MYRLYSKELLMAEDSPYAIDEVLFERSTPGTYKLEIEAKGKYEVYCIGGGAGGARWYASRSRVYNQFCGGGSGSGFIGFVRLNKGTISIAVGSASGKVSNGQAAAGGNSSIGEYIISYGGIGGRAFKGDGTPGNGGTIPTINVKVIETILNTKGNTGGNSGGPSGSDVGGGASVYSGYGGGGRSNGDGTSGYVKIVYKGK